MTATEPKTTELDSKTVNLIENAALHTAASNKGRLHTAQLLPYFSLSLKTLDQCVANMVDNSSIMKSVETGITCYEFKNLSAKAISSADLNPRHISLEGEDLKRTKIEHQVIFVSSGFKDRIFAESIAASTDFTLQEVKEILKELSLDKFISEHLDEEKGSIYYTFPEVKYLERHFKSNMQYLRLTNPLESFDAKAPIFVKYMFICLIMLCLLFFAKVPNRLLIFFFLLSIPLSAILTYFNYKK